MTIETLKSPNPRNRNSISVIKSKFLSVSSMNTLLAILKVTEARRDVILAGGLYHRFPWRQLPPPWERQTSAFFEVRVCHPNVDSHRDLTPKQIYQKHENDKERQYAERVMEIEQGTFTPLVFTTTGGMANECVKYHSRLAELIANKKGESYSSTS